jgi:hypothetical protein
MVKSSTMTFINEEDDLVFNMATANNNTNNNKKARSSFLMTNPTINTNTFTRPSKQNRIPSSSSLHSIKSHQTQQLNSNSNNTSKLNALNSVSSHQQLPSLNNSISSIHNTSLTEVEYNGIICQEFFLIVIVVLTCLVNVHETLLFKNGY